MLTGVILGILIILLVFTCFFLSGSISEVRSQRSALDAKLAAAEKELYEYQLSLGRFVRLEQERAKLKESLVVNFTEEQITELASKISVRIKTLMEAEQAARLAKLN